MMKARKPTSRSFQNFIAFVLRLVSTFILYNVYSYKVLYIILVTKKLYNKNLFFLVAYRFFFQNDR